MSEIEYVGEKAFHDLIECYYSGENYYMSNRLKFKNEYDMVFISNEDIINYISKNLQGKYSLKVDKVQRVLNSICIENEDFTFEDTELKIILNDNDNDE